MGYFWFLGATPAKHPFLNISAPEHNIKNCLGGSLSMCWLRVYPKFQLTTLFGIGCRWGWAKKGSHIFKKEDSCSQRLFGGQRWSFLIFFGLNCKRQSICYKGIFLFFNKCIYFYKKRLNSSEHLS